MHPSIDSGTTLDECDYQTQRPQPCASQSPISTLHATSLRASTSPSKQPCSLQLQTLPPTQAMALPLPPTIASPQHHTPARTPMHGPHNVGNVVLGNLRITPEYPSFYPEDLIGGRTAQWLYVCHSCFRYTHELMKYAAHCVSFLTFGRRLVWEGAD
jgi:hypothetical protein